MLGTESRLLWRQWVLQLQPPRAIPDPMAHFSSHVSAVFFEKLTGSVSFSFTRSSQKSVCGENLCG